LAPSAFASTGSQSKRQFPIVGDGHGFMSFIHLDDAATATALARSSAAPRASTTSSTTNRPQCALEADPVVLDLLDAPAVRRAVHEAQPEAIIHEGTALADARFSRNVDKTLAQTNRLRTEGTDALLAAAREAGVRRFVAQSFAPWRYAREGGMVKTEEDPLDPALPAAIGARLVPQLIDRGHEVIGTCRSPDNAECVYMRLRFASTVQFPRRS
jgi:nucleoside-diphosphate-sugar epimerase